MSGPRLTGDRSRFSSLLHNKSLQAVVAPQQDLVSPVHRAPTLLILSHARVLFRSIRIYHRIISSSAFLSRIIVLVKREFGMLERAAMRFRIFRSCVPGTYFHDSEYCPKPVGAVDMLISSSELFGDEHPVVPSSNSVLSRLSIAVQFV